MLDASAIDKRTSIIYVELKDSASGYVVLKRFNKLLLNGSLPNAAVEALAVSIDFSIT